MASFHFFVNQTLAWAMLSILIIFYWHYWQKFSELCSQHHMITILFLKIFKNPLVPIIPFHCWFISSIFWYLKNKVIYDQQLLSFQNVLDKRKKISKMFTINVSWKHSYFLQIKKLCFIHADNLYWYIDFPKLLTPFFWFQYTKIATHSPLNMLVDAQSRNSHNIFYW